MKITKISMISGKENTLDLNITEEQLTRYNAGDGLIQNIFPDLTPGEREFLMTGITEEEWDKHLRPG
jgi:hypothetical protein